MSPKLQTCIACGARKMSRKTVLIERRGERGAVKVPAGVCGACGERYFGLDAMRMIEG